MKKLVSLALATVAFVAPASADAATCADPSVNVSATPTLAVEDTTVSYSYGFCHNTQGDRYTVQVVDAATEQPVTPLRSVALNGSVGQESGADSFTPDRAGRFRVVVAYYRVGQTAWEAKGEVVVRVTAAPAPQPTPQPTVPPVQPTPAPQQPVATPAPVQPTPAPQQPVATPAPVQPVATPVVEDAPAEPVAQVKPGKARIKLVKSAVKRTVKAGGTATFKLTVKSVGKVAAKGVRVCDPLPKNTQYRGASMTADFQGRAACFKLGTMKPGKAKTVTLRLTVDTDATGKVVNRATATATNAKTVRDTATVKVPRSTPKRVHAPVTG